MADQLDDALADWGNERKWTLRVRPTSDAELLEVGQVELRTVTTNVAASPLFQQCPHESTALEIDYRDGGTWVDERCDVCKRVIRSRPSRFSPKAWAQFYGD